MGAGTRSTDEVETPRAALLELGKGAVILVALAGLLRGLTLWLGNPMTAALLGALLVSLVAPRAGLRSDPGGAGARRRAALAGAASLAVAALATASVLVTGGELHFAGPSMTMLFGLAESVALAYRDELWLHGLPLVFATRARVPLRYAAAFGAACSVAAHLLAEGVQPSGLVLAGAAGLFFAVLWVRTRDAWAPVGAHFVWIFVVEAVLSGELLDVVSSASRLARGASATGIFAWCASLGFMALSLAVWRGKLRMGRAELRDE